MVSTGQLLWQLNKAIAPSHPSGLPTVLSDVRYWMNSRRHLLAASISGFDPCATSAASCECLHTRFQPLSKQSFYPLRCGHLSLGLKHAAARVYLVLGRRSGGMVILGAGATE